MSKSGSRSASKTKVKVNTKRSASKTQQDDEDDQECCEVCPTNGGFQICAQAGAGEEMEICVEICDNCGRDWVCIGLKIIAVVAIVGGLGYLAYRCCSKSGGGGGGGDRSGGGSGGSTAKAVNTAGKNCSEAVQKACSRSTGNSVSCYP